MAIRTGRPVNRALSASRQANGKTVLIDQYTKGEYSQYFEVRDLPLVVQLIGATGATIYVMTSFKSSTGEVEQVAHIEGQTATLNTADNTLVLDVSGRYRVHAVGGMGTAVCVYGPLLTSDKERDIPQPSGAQANRPNLFLDNGERLSHTIEVGRTAWVFNIYGLGSSDSVEVLAVYGHGPTYREIPYSTGGVAAVLTDSNTSIVLDVSGRYRFRSSQSTAGKILVGNPTILAAVTYKDSGNVSSVPGPKGDPGPRGKDGQIRFTGIGPPGTLVGSCPGDTYMDIASGDVYKLT